MIKLTNLLLTLVSWVGYQPQMALLITALVLALLYLKFRREATWLAISGIGAYIISNGLKILVHEARPPLSLLTDWSFPSGHVLTFVACFGFLAYVIFKQFPISQLRTTILVLLISLILLVGPSRLYLGDHWLNDVLAGYLLGGVWLAIVVRLFNSSSHTSRH